ncbi:MAG: hypothetical protein IKC87_06740 [Clostridia bacterium]|nr:hypothetical protein [Clostridia bacterium]
MEKLIYIKSQWSDHVGSSLVSKANDAVYRINNAASDAMDVVRRVEDTKIYEIEFKSRTPELQELKARLERELGI